MGQNRLTFLSNAALNSSDLQWRSFDEAVSIAENISAENSYMPQAVTSMINQKESSPNDSMLGLELGKRTYFGVPGSMNHSNINGGQIYHTNSNSKVTTQKRPRISTLNPKCQVEGCKSDLSSVKDYHRRHKVCPLHSKSAMVIVSGQEQRFCQQCSRFHGLIEFDEGKRSCRRRLAGHNERRRKPQPDSFGLNTRFLPAFQDNRRFGRLFSDRYLAPDEKTQAMSAPWDDSDGLNGERKGLLLSSSSPPRMMMTTTAAAVKYEEQSSSSSSPLPCSMPTSGMGIEQLFLAGLQRQSERRLHCLPQNLEKAGLGEIPVSCKASCYGSVGSLMHQSLSLVSSSSEGLEEAIAVGHHGFTRLSDSSGCALSLQSTMQHLCSAQASAAAAAESLDSTSGLVSSDHHDLQSNSVRKASITTGQPLLLGQQTALPAAESAAAQSEFGWANDDDNKLPLLPPALTSMHDASSLRKAQFSSHDDLSCNGRASECIRLYSMLHGGGGGGGGGGGEIQGVVDGMPEDVKPTIDLMHAACTQHGQSSETMASVAASSSSAPFEIGACQFGDLQAFRSYGPSIFSSQHI